MQLAKIDLNAALSDAQNSLTSRLEEIQREIAEKFSDLLKTRLERYLDRSSNEEDWARCSIRKHTFYFEETPLMQVIVGDLKMQEGGFAENWYIRQEIKYLEL